MHDEKEQLRSFILTIVQFIEFPISDSSLDPIRKTKSLRGLREAANDMAELREELSSDQIVEIDDILLRQNLPSLTQMADRRYRALREILVRNRIESDDEWRFVESFVVAQDTKTLSEKERVEAERLLAHYESS